MDCDYHFIIGRLDDVFPPDDLGSRPETLC